MAKFSVGREDDGEGPSSPRPKRQRTTCSGPQQEHQLVEYEAQEEEEDEEEPECDEEEEDEEQEEGESEEGEEEDGGGGDLIESERVNVGEPSSNGERRCSAGPSGDGSISVTLTDPDVLDCPICLEPLCTPVFQCENGHIACSSCCIKIGNKCPSCSWPIGYNRCRAIEKVIESVKISCQNVKYGCEERVSYGKKHEHEGTCIYAPCSCPVSDCTFVGSSKLLFLHFRGMHSNRVKRFWYNCLFPVYLENQGYVILQEENEGTIFILNNGLELLGNVVNINCIEPSSSKKGYPYDLIARKEEGSSVRLQSFTESIPHWVQHTPSERFLLVPCDFLSGGKLKLEICIRKHHEVPARICRGNRNRVPCLK